MSEKRPETSADIVTRSKRVGGHLLRSGYSVDLPRHMAECDANYHRLLQLFPNLRDEDAISFTLEMPNFAAHVVFTVEEKGPYTTLLKISVDSEDKWVGMTAAPDMSIRVYHDARSAEVVSYQNQNRFHGKYEYPNTRMRQRDEKAQINRFLSEFLTVCLTHGISREPVSFSNR